MVNGAFFVASGEGVEVKYEKAYSVEPKSAVLIDQIVMHAGVLGVGGRFVILFLITFSSFYYFLFLLSLSLLLSLFPFTFAHLLSTPLTISIVTGPLDFWNLDLEIPEFSSKLDEIDPKSPIIQAQKLILF
jgi:hypothetical protein